MEFVEPEDEPNPFRGPIHPDDRLWRHPSELGARPGVPPAQSGFQPLSAAQERHRDGSDRPSRSTVWMVAAASALGASLLSSGLVLVAAALLIGDDTPAVVEREMVPRPVAATSTPVHGISGEGIVEVARRVRPAMAQVRKGMGSDIQASAVMFRSDGYLLTSAHVVGGSSAIEVVLADGRELAARLVGIDIESDTAVVKVEGGPYPVATLGRASGLMVGEPAIAFGSPKGQVRGTAVSLGVISGLHRNVRAAAGGPMLFDMVQTDAPIAAGCAGGALVDSDGSVVGITAPVAEGDGHETGFGFATPIELVRAVAEQIIDTGAAQAVWMGVEGGDVDGAVARDLSVEGGAMVEEVNPGGPANRGGVVRHDVIVAVDGTPLTTMGQLVAMLKRHRPGDAVVLDVRRGQETRSLLVTLAARPGRTS